MKTIQAILDERNLEDTYYNRHKLEATKPKLKWSGYEDMLLAILLSNRSPESLAKRGQKLVKNSQLVDYIIRSKILDTNN